MEKLIALAEALDAARRVANELEETAPQADAYGDIAEAIKKVLFHIVGSKEEAERVYDFLIETDEPIRDCLVAGYDVTARGISDSYKITNRDGETIGRVYLDLSRYSPERAVDRVLPLQDSMAAAIFTLVQDYRLNR